MRIKLVKPEHIILRRNLRIAAAVALVVLSGGAVFYHFVEGLSWLDSFYFCTITLTTVGYGDISPHTVAGKLFTIFYILAGIGILATFANLLLKRTVMIRSLKHDIKTDHLG
jgi:voltage-gated potassium channel Kch